MSSFDFPGLSMNLTEEVAILSSQLPLYTLASTVTGGGFQRTHTIMNRHVPMTYNCSDPARDLIDFASSLGLIEPFVGMLTGVPIHGTRAVTMCHNELRVTSVITAGIGNAITAGITPPATLRPGTINIVTLVDAQLSEAAMVNAVITVTEAKTAVLNICGVRTTSDQYATGTSTDALVIACTGHGPLLPYAGPATPVGYLIATSVRKCLMMALEPCNVFPLENIGKVAKECVTE